MEPGTRIANPSGVVVKNRSSSGCLIVRKKGDGLGGDSSSSRKQYESKKVRKKVKEESSDSESSGELLMPPVRRPGPETIRVCNSLSAIERGGNVGSSEISRKRERMEQIRRNGDDMVEGNGLERRDKKVKLEVFDFDEYDVAGAERMRRRQFDGDGVSLGGGRFMGTMHSGRGSIDREFESGSSRHIVDKRKSTYHDRASGSYLGDSVDHSRIKVKREGTQHPPSLLKEKFNSDESIRVQGKNGVLKVMVNKKKTGGSVEHYEHRKPVESRHSGRAEGTSKRNIPIQPSSRLETKSAEKQGVLVRPEKKQITRKSLSSKEDSKGDEQDSDNNDTSMNLEVKNIKAHTSSKKITSENEQTPVHDKLPTTKSSEGKIRRGSGTEKQKLREQIREMLLNKGWTIDYRPRRNRDYLDAVYINPGGTAYWSIIKAYDALQKQLIEDDQEAKAKGASSSFAPIADDVLNQLTRKTRKKMEKDLKMKKKKQRADDNDSGKERQIKRTAGKKHHMNGNDSDSNEDKLSSFIKQGGKSVKTKLPEISVTGGSSKSQNATTDKSFSESDPKLLHGRKSRKHGRCTLLVRSSNKGLNSESDDFVPYTGKRTVLSWLVDSGVVQVSQKVQYRRRKRVMLEGWITREGIHCGCCSKILTVSKFELHAGSKLPQPYQNIYLDSGVSLLQCQIDAWEKQENSGKISFHSVDVDGNDPNDDTCGICGDGGDLICCDGCPSTFHQSCLDIQMLPPGDWHCPNCTCKFCGLASGSIDKEDDATVYALQTCDLCEKKYHDCCTKDVSALHANSNMSGHSFCGKSCKELFEHLKKYLGTKHELDAGFTWCLVRRTDNDSEAASRGVTQRVECNSKLAVALTVMDECFLPVVDRRSGINLIHNSLYNSGSNFNRLNYTGFYTAILERGDEIISAASIRFHGTKLAEMPFIGTRHIYRHQGMCRRLFSAIEHALCSLKVEKLVIPAISELVHTWTTAFGFTHLEESLRQEMRSLNMLVFPGIDMLQKLLVEQGKLDDAEQFENGGVVSVNPTVVNRLGIDSLALQDPHESEDASSNPANKINTECSDASQDISSQGLTGRTVCSKSHSEERLSDSVSENCASPSNSSHGVLKKKKKISTSSPIDDMSPKCLLISPNGKSTNGLPSDPSDCHELPALCQATACSDLGTIKIEPVSDGKLHAITDMNCGLPGLARNPVLDSQVVDNAFPSKEFDMNDAQVEVLEVGLLVNSSQGNNIKENNENVDYSGSALNNAFTDMDSPELDQNSVLDSRVANNALSIKEFDMNDAPVEVLEAGPLVNSSEENNAKVNNENVDDSGSVLNHAFTDMKSGSPGLDQNPVLDSCVVDNVLSFKEVDMNDAHVEVLEAGSLVNSSQGNNTKENNKNVDVSDSVLNHTFTAMNSDSPGLDQNSVLDSQVADNALSFKELDMNDAHVRVLEAGPFVNSTQGNNTEDNENVDVSGSALNNAYTDMNSDSPGLDQNPVLDSQLADNALSFKEFDMNDARVEVLEAGPLVSSTQGNNTEENNDNVDVSGSILNHAGESSWHVRSDLNGKIAHEVEKKSHLDSKVASNEMHFDETGPNASGNSTKTDRALNG
ncbi:uncharacterized protein LOC127097096 isoform X2 [Lathyrus oleraceus]|uniref:PHD-type domain-containing protein n=1 Tax=Pisum sativum TaxID=3888 RepID=A0A9D5A7P8_PEA|nr:uncharacterized protein LOC127097096 isoform X2 [Pisum sativum]KAI5400837.1 hypothetical protein KIW84_065627 [Pisum sativum]